MIKEFGFVEIVFQFRLRESVFLFLDQLTLVTKIGRVSIVVGGVFGANVVDVVVHSRVEASLVVDSIQSVSYG